MEVQLGARRPGCAARARATYCRVICCSWPHLKADTLGTVHVPLVHRQSLPACDRWPRSFSGVLVEDVWASATSLWLSLGHGLVSQVGVPLVCLKLESLFHLFVVIKNGSSCLPNGRSCGRLHGHQFHLDDDRYGSMALAFTAPKGTNHRDSVGFNKQRALLLEHFAAAGFQLRIRSAMVKPLPKPVRKHKQHTCTCCGGKHRIENCKLPGAREIIRLRQTLASRKGAGPKASWKMKLPVKKSCSSKKHQKEARKLYGSNYQNSWKRTRGPKF